MDGAATLLNNKCNAALMELMRLSICPTCHQTDYWELAVGLFEAINMVIREYDGFYANLMIYKKCYTCNTRTIKRNLID